MSTPHLVCLRNFQEKINSTLYVLEKNQKRRPDFGNYPLSYTYIYGGFQEFAMFSGVHIYGTSDQLGG